MHSCPSRAGAPGRTPWAAAGLLGGAGWARAVAAYSGAGSLLLPAGQPAAWARHGAVQRRRGSSTAASPALLACSGGTGNQPASTCAVVGVRGLDSRQGTRAGRHGERLGVVCGACTHMRIGVGKRGCQRMASPVLPLSSQVMRLSHSWMRAIKGPDRLLDGIAPPLSWLRMRLHG